MQRRQFLKNAGASIAGGAIAAPAYAQAQIRWRMASSFPKSLDTLYGTAEQLATRVSRLTDGRFEIRVFAANEIVPPLQVLDAVQNGTVECGQTAGYYYIGKNPALAFDTALPFGLFGLLWLIAPHFYGDVWNQPIVKPVLFLAGLWLLIGNVVMHRMVRFKI